MKYDDDTTNPIWRTAAILKIILLVICRRFIARLTWNSVRRSIIMFRHKSHDQHIKFRKFKMTNGRHFKQEAQLMLTTGSTRLAVSRGQQTWYHSTCCIWFPIVQTANSNFVFNTRRFYDIRLQKISWPWNGGQRSLKVIESGIIR